MNKPASEEDRRAFQGHYQQFFGRPHAGLDFWLSERPSGSQV